MRLVRLVALPFLMHRLIFYKPFHFAKEQKNQDRLLRGYVVQAVFDQRLIVVMQSETGFFHLSLLCIEHCCCRGYKRRQKEQWPPPRPPKGGVSNYFR